MRDLILDNYIIYSKQNEKDDLYILENIKTNVINIFKSNKLFNEIKRDLYNKKNLLYAKKISFFMNLLITEKLIKSVYDVGFKPILEKTYKQENKLFLNSYTPTYYLQKNNFETYEGDYKEYLNLYAPNIYYLISNLCNFNNEYIDYFIMWLSHKVQKPHEKIQRGIVFYGAESSGKTLFFNSIIKTIFNKYAHIGSMKNLDPNKNTSQYNGHKSKIVISATDECYYLSSVEETLKAEITQENKLINVKGGTQWEEICFEDQLFFSNRELPIKAGNKRLSFIKANTLKGDEKKATEWYELFYEPNYINELNYLCNVLHHINIDKSIIMNNIKNEELEEIQNLTKSLEEKFIDFLGDFKTLDDVENYLIKFSKIPIKNKIINNIKKQNDINYIPITDIYKLYDLWLLSIDYDKKAIDKTQLLKVLRIDTKDKNEYNRLRFEGKAIYCVNIEKLKNLINRVDCDDDEDNKIYENVNNHNYDVNEIMTEVK